MKHQFSPTEQARAVAKVGLAVLEAIDEAGPMGAPSGVLYAALMGQGCNLQQFQQLTEPLVRRGYVTVESDLFVMTAAGREFTHKLKAALQ